MIAFIIRISLALVAAFFNVYLFATGHWGWGISFIFITALIILSFFRNENMILALNQMRVGNQDKAKAYINKISHPQFLPKKQHAYVLYLKAVLGAQELGFAPSAIPATLNTKVAWFRNTWKHIQDWADKRTTKYAIKYMVDNPDGAIDLIRAAQARQKMRGRTIQPQQTLRPSARTAVESALVAPNFMQNQNAMSRQ